MWSCPAGPVTQNEGHKRLIMSDDQPDGYWVELTSVQKITEDRKKKEAITCCDRLLYNPKKPNENYRYISLFKLK